MKSARRATKERKINKTNKKAFYGRLSQKHPIHKIIHNSQSFTISTPKTDKYLLNIILLIITAVYNNNQHRKTNWLTDSEYILHFKTNTLGKEILNGAEKFFEIETTEMNNPSNIIIINNTYYLYFNETCT